MLYPQPLAALDERVGFLAVARVGDEAVLAAHSSRGTSTEARRAFEAALAGLLKRASALPAYPGWKDRASVEDGFGGEAGGVYMAADAKALTVTAVGIHGTGYPDRLAHQLLEELCSTVSANVSDVVFSEAQPGMLTTSLKPCMKEVMMKFSDPSQIDKVTEVHQKVDQVKGIMQNNVKKIVETHATLHELEGRSASMNQSADQFLKQSTQVKRQAQCREIKVKLVAGLTVAAVMLFITIPLVWN